jgi:hypothetical protein
MEQVTPLECPLNVIYIRDLRGHFSKESLEHVDAAGARQLFSGHVHTIFVTKFICLSALSNARMFSVCLILIKTATCRQCRIAEALYNK